MRLLFVWLSFAIGLTRALSADSAISIAAVRDLYDGRHSVIEFALPGRGPETFEFSPGTLLPPDFPYPIKSLRGRSLADPGCTATAVVTGDSIALQVFHSGGVLYLNSRPRDAETLRLQPAPDTGRNLSGYQCLGAIEATPPPAEGTLRQQSAAHVFRTFRLAAGATGEFTEYFGSKQEAVRQVVMAMTRAGEIFRREVGVILELVPDFDRMVFADKTSDPFTSNDPTEDTLKECQAAFDAIIGNANYDVGIVLTRGLYGLAYIRGVCDPARKGASCIGLPEPEGDAFHVNLVTHELGHQFGANHTFNSPMGLCSERRNEWAAFEPGAGSTIMSYSSLPCGDDSFQPRHDAYFHSESLKEMRAFLESPAVDCAVVTPTFNAPPLVHAGHEYTIPVGTPFALTATATDPNGDDITYCWEERDLGPAQVLGGPDNGLSPRFRSFPPTASPTRLFPALEHILAGTDAPEERLPQTNRFLRFRVVARDSHDNGAVSWADTQLRVTNMAGPFRITSHNAAQTLCGSTRVEWTTGGTERAPISAGYVRITLSTNGGLSFPILLAGSAPNDGAEDVVLPAIDITDARIKIEPLDNVFFDINDAPLTISSLGNSELRLKVVPTPGGRLLVSWPSVAGTTYRLERSGALPPSLWSLLLVTNAPGSNVSVTLSASADASYYRVLKQ